MVYMAKTLITTDDLDGSPDAETVKFSYAGISYAIDLGKKNRTALEKALKPYIDVAQRTSARRGSSASRTRRGRATRRRTAGPDLAEVRAWARENGIQVSERGRIAQTVIDAYTEAHA